MGQSGASTCKTSSTSGWILRGLLGLWSHDRKVLVAVLILFIGIGFFWWLTEQVTGGKTPGLDERLIRILREPGNAANPVGPPWVEEAARDITSLGGYAVLTGLTIAVAVFLGFAGKHHAGWLLFAAIAGGTVVMHFLKAQINRPRPDLVPHLSHANSASFPSGHAMLSAIVYLALGAMLARLVTRPRLKWFFLTLALMLTFLIGISRVYLGVHYPTDVLAGWAAGLVWAILCWLVTRALQLRGTIEQDPEETPVTSPQSPIWER